MENLGHLDHHGKVRGKDIEDVVARLSYSDWLVLYYLAQVRIFFDFTEKYLPALNIFTHFSFFGF